MIFEKVKKFLIENFQEKITQRGRLYITISLGWIIFIGYLTWWNGLKSMSLDKSFKWDEWFWFGIVPALAPYLFYFIWKDQEKLDKSE
ncbi:hypothetical protein CL646_03310 [bacterium]|nr:hypothetical protein [bacterium]|tara:strand:- start:344 stop:607 length:264 start_codon:yes stop_codon:yes gene_type:complete